ncbi:MAG: hypothetical protein VX815_01215 [Gemmatimonadota bacterium]|nr:hypothetical protein [Gemmatimonadota bacterium]
MTAATLEPEGAPALPGNNLGRLICLTLFTPVRRQWLPVLSAALWIAKWVPFAQRHILQFNFIHFVRWTVVRELPFAGPREERDRLNYGYLFFESNFDGPWQHYIDAFAYCIPQDIRFVWGRGPAFPYPPPAEPLKKWIAMNSMEGGSYYCAYPESSTRMVMSAVAVKDALGDFVASSADLGPDEFKTRYDQFLSRLQNHL